MCEEGREQDLTQRSTGLSSLPCAPSSLEADVVPDVPALLAALAHAELPPASHMLGAPFGGLSFSPASCFLLPLGFQRASVPGPNCPEAAKQLGHGR